MENKYDFSFIEKKWRQKWLDTPINEDKGQPKFYCLDMFPYPSAAGIHLGHWRGYVISDVLSRKKLLEGHFIIHPMGWDAFGLPAENYAIKNNVHPEIAVKESVKTFKSQLMDISAMYNWDYELSTTDPNFYKWTQWIFVQMYKKGLAYEKEMPLNWCENCKTVLANEEAAGGFCDRCNEPTTKKNLRQWMLKITAYAERLLIDLDKLNWPKKVLKMQAEWIGKSYGAKVNFPLENGEQISVFTTRPDTIFGATFMVLAPEHPLVAKITTDSQKNAVDAYVKEIGAVSSVDRMSKKQKTGVFTGAYAINPVNQAKMPVWIADYVLLDYGTGAIMAVPGHDERDFEFATENQLPIVYVYDDDGIMINSDSFNGLETDSAKEKIADHIESKGFGEKTVNYKLRDWVFSRQRYWGEPIPLIHCEDCGVVPVPEADLPVKLPFVDSYKPTTTGESPLADIADWVNVACPSCGKNAKRETNTMPQWAGSSWYFLRYLDKNNQNELISQEKSAKYMPVDYYVGGVEHAVLHLLYARFYTKFLYDIGVVDFEEPFKQLFNQGMVTRFGKKMAKSAGNGVSPDDFVKKYGTDALRMYILFIGPPELDSDWDDNGIEGVYRFLNKFWRLIVENTDKFVKTTAEHEFLANNMVYDISNRLDNFSLNTVVSGFMEYTNKLTELAKTKGLDKKTAEAAVIMLAPLAPHIAEEIWEILGNSGSVFKALWPKYDTSKMQSDSIKIVLQINGKLRDTLDLPANSDKDFIINKAKETLAERLAGQVIIKEVYVPLKLVNFVVRNS